MKLFSYIGDYFLLHWLFGKVQHTENNDEIVRKSIDSHGYSSNSYDSHKYDWDNQSYNNLHEEQDDYDMMDDF